MEQKFIEKMSKNFNKDKEKSDVKYLNRDKLNLL